MKGFDYSAGQIAPADLIGAGAGFVARYLCPRPNTKGLLPDEAAELLGAGLGIVLVWESTAARASEGFGAGVADASEANAQAEWCGMAGAPVYFAVDYDAAGADVAGYFAGVVSVIGHDRTGVYGSARIVDDVVGGGAARWGWQTLAWSYGAMSNHADLYQNGETATVGGIACDADYSHTDPFGATFRAPQPTEDEVADIVVIDPWSGGSWCVAADSGAVFSDGEAPYLGGLNNHPDWNAGTAAAPVVGAAAWTGDGQADGGRGYVIWTKDAAGARHAYRFPRDGRYAK